MKRQRYVAPARDSIETARFDAPLFGGLRRFRAWLDGEDWPTLSALNAALEGAAHPYSGASLSFAAQTPDLLADGLHYEQRILQQGRIATREANWHDLFNAMVWLQWTPLKAALNLRQAADIEAVGPKARTRGQCALTHFDEAGAVVLLRDATLLERWDAHDWHGLFWDEAAAWRDGRAEVVVFGHALYEHGLQPRPVHSAKCLVLLLAADAAPAPAPAPALAALAGAIARGEVLLDPQELRPLPLSGVPGWHPDTATPAFYAQAPCFRPLRAGRRYPPPSLAS